MKKATDAKTKALGEELAALAAMPDDAIDTSDAPEVADWSDAERGRFAIVASDADRRAG